MFAASALIEKFQYALDNDFGYIYGTAGIIWTEARQKNATREMTVKYGKKWIGHMVADCSGLFRWAYKQLGSDIAHGSNSIYKGYCSRKGLLNNGKRTDGYELLPGTAVFTGTEDDHGHIGLYIGDGYVIEAKGTQNGVIKSKVTEKKWTYWGELKAVEYGEKKPVDPSEDGYPTLRRGDKGKYVQLAQAKLVNKGYSVGSAGIDGDFGKATEAAVKEFQKDNGLTVDGIIGKNTWAALDNITTTLYTVTIPHLTKTVAENLVAQFAGSTMTEERG